MKKKIWLVQQGVWDMPVESMPLAMGYLKAVGLADEGIRSETDLRIFNFRGGDTVVGMTRRLFFDEIPDVIAFSVFGWNFQSFTTLAETFRHFNHQGWVIFGGTHVAHQAKRVFGVCPAVDVVVDGEGERTFRELLHAYLGGQSRHELSAIKGISFKAGDGSITKTAARERILDLDEIPSPFLTGALEMNDANGQFKYDVALLETNRGCPYRCSFCYWGGAIGQKIRKFSRDRLREELDFFGRHKIHNVVLCDANFGMLREDEHFVEDLIETRKKHGYPRSLETSWAKNKSKIFYDIVRRMKETGFRSSFTLALQTLDDAALDLMQRKNMKVNDWEDLAAWLSKEGFDCYAELIWGAPGETYASFIEGYDRLAQYVSRIAVYPLLLMPNTEYSESRKKYGLVTLRSNKDDFEYVLRHQTMSVEDNDRMLHFLFWARVVAENMIFRHIWLPLRILAGVLQSQVLLSLDSWFERQADSVSLGLKKCRAEMVDNIDGSRVANGIRYFYLRPDLDVLLERWWREDILPRVPAQLAEFFTELFRYDLVTRAIYADRRSAIAKDKDGRDLTTREVDGETYYVRENLEFAYDVPSLIEKIKSQQPLDLQPSKFRTTLYYKVGFRELIDNHEFVLQFVGKTRQQIAAEIKKASDEPVLIDAPADVSVNPSSSRLTA